MEELQPGDVVRLKSDNSENPKLMTVEYPPSTGQVDVMWFVGDDLRRARIGKQALVKVK